MRGRLLATVLLGGCIAARPKLVRELHNERAEVDAAESSELAYRSRTPDLEPLLGMTRAELSAELGPGRCAPQPPGQRCTWPFASQPRGERAAPLLLELDFDAAGVCRAARWAENE